jgi:hypothetical protein
MHFVLDPEVLNATEDASANVNVHTTRSVLCALSLAYFMLYQYAWMSCMHVQWRQSRKISFITGSP